jgi:hypothetical protein
MFENQLFIAFTLGEAGAIGPCISRTGDPALHFALHNWHVARQQGP